MGYMVSTSGRIVLNESDPVKAVVQNIRMILLTRQKTVPLYRDFGLPMQFIDKPMAAAKPLMVAEINEAISEFEPRAEVINITFETDDNVPGRLIPTVEIEVNIDE